ncbi:MAG TPA: hypothetical protein VF832_14240 [Longimicrobiales bacterium]
MTQFASVVLAAAQAYVIYRSRRAAIRAAQDERARRALLEQHRLARQQARLGWAPAFDQRLLSQASLGQAARIWAAAAPWAEADQDAASAMHGAEGRLRTLHPYAMSWYDRLRSEGMEATAAMTEAAPLFDRPARVRQGSPGRPRAALPAALPGDGARLSSLVIDIDDATVPSVTDLAAARAAALAAQSFPATAADALRAGAGAAVGRRPPRREVRQQVTRPRMKM